jgi:sec-independent protein translocase protein TatA
MLLAEIAAWQIIIVALVVLLLFGARIPDTMRNLGKGLSEFKKGLREGEKEPPQESSAEKNAAGKSGPTPPAA